MSEFQTSLIISGSIFALMMFSQYGRRRYEVARIIIPILVVIGFGIAYLRDIPLAGADIALYAAGIAIGAGFAVLATITTGLEKDDAGKIFTITGAGFVVTWLIAMALRVGFVWSVDNIPSFRNEVGRFLMSTGIVTDAIAPFFVLMALTTVIGRVAAVRVRTVRLARSAVNAPLPVAA